MKRSVTQGLLLGLVLSFCGSMVFAEVKLRLYLKDGSLQSGNLVSETESLFVLLTKNGREEVPKDKIMFVNGKPLVYWKQHPERNYQTEIIPTDVPNPSFVNDKAALPQVALAPATPLPKLAQVLPTPEKPKPTATPTPVSTPTSTPVPVMTPAPTPIPTAPPKEVKRRAKRAPSNLSAFSREGMAAYFADRGARYLEMGQRGRAMQDFHLAVVLNRQDVKSSLQLGGIYAEQGVRKWAEKFLKSPGLKKSAEAKTFLDTLDEVEKKANRQKKFLFGGAAAGVVMIIPALALFRSLTHKKEAVKHVISADELSDLVTPAEAEADIAMAIEAEKEPVAPPPPPPILKPVEKPIAQKPIVSAPPPISAPPPMKPEPPKPVPPPEPMPVPVLASQPEEPKFEPVPALAASLPPDDTRRTMDDLIRSREDFLQVSKTVDELVAKGHTLASDGSLEKARKTYRTALALHPQSLEATLGLAYLCFIQENWELALEHYLHAAQINPKSADVHYGIGRVFLETGHEPQAIEEFRQTLSLDPTFYEARETLSALGVAV